MCTIGGSCRLTQGLGMTRIIAIANQKGGVAKTTTVASIGAALAEMGQRVLVVDLDPQACLTFSVGMDPESLEFSVHDVLLGRVSGAGGRTTDDGLRPPARDDRPGGAEAQLLMRTGREYVLRTALEEIAADYDRAPGLQPVARRPDPQRADRRRRGAHPAAVRDPLPPRGRTAARHRARRPAPPTATSGPRGAADAVRQPDQPLARGPGRRDRAVRPARCSARRSRSRCASPRHRPPAARCSRPRGPPGAEAYRALARRLLDGTAASARPP